MWSLKPKAQTSESDHEHSRHMDPLSENKNCEPRRGDWAARRAWVPTACVDRTSIWINGHGQRSWGEECPEGLPTETRLLTLSGGPILNASNQLPLHTGLRISIDADKASFEEDRDIAFARPRLEDDTIADTFRSTL
jgi:hypothetical protein